VTTLRVLSPAKNLTSLEIDASLPKPDHVSNQVKIANLRQPASPDKRLQSDKNMKSLRSS
jgi:hypothetical protein